MALQEIVWVPPSTDVVGDGGACHTARSRDAAAEPVHPHGFPKPHFDIIPCMELVLLSNLLWIVFLSGWCVLYFIQARADRRGPARYPDYVDPR